MPNRYSKKVHDTLYRFIAARDGEYCIEPTCRRGPLQGVSLQIDHADNDPANWDPENLHLLCQRHNLAMRGLSRARHVALMKRYSDINVCVCIEEKGHANNPDAKLIADYRSGSEPMVANSIFEPICTEYYLKTVKAEGQVVKKDLVSSAAFLAHCNMITATRYLEPLTSPRGPLQEAKDGFGNVVVTLRHFRPTVIRATHGGKAGKDGIAASRRQRSRTTVRSIRASADNAGKKGGKDELCT